MRASKMGAMRPLSILPGCVIAALLLISQPVFGAAPGDGVASYVATLPTARMTGIAGHGKLDRLEAIFHVQLIGVGGERTQQIIVLREDDGKTLARVDQSPLMENMGGSGNWNVQEIDIADGSLFVTESYHWRYCFGSSRSQFRFVDGVLLMIGSESSETNTSTSVTVDSSSNLLTGQGYWIEERGRRKVKHTARVALKAVPFSAFGGRGWISPYHKNVPVCR
jgi:hypothetical protein